MWQEFKEFGIRGNAIELAIGVILATSFQPIVKSLVDDIIMPPIGMIAGKVDFTDKYIALDGNEYESLAKARESAPVIGYGQTINTVINFMIIAFCVFLIVKAMNHLKRKEEAAPKAPPAEERLLTEIRDLLKAKA